MIREFNSLKDIQKYYDANTNTYVFMENEEYIGVVVFNFDLSINASIDAYNIEACDINANDITALDINANDINANDINANDITALDINANDINANDIAALDINAWNIDACDISYWGVCFAYNSIKCKSITSKRENHKHFVLDGELVVEEDE